MIRKLSPAKPKTFNYHYSNPSSQGALVCQTKGFPEEHDDEKEATLVPIQTA